MDRSKSVPAIHTEPTKMKTSSMEQVPRAVFRKRESARICSEFNDGGTTADVKSEEGPVAVEVATQFKPVMISQGIQTRKFNPKFRRPSHRSRWVQTSEDLTEHPFPRKCRKTEAQDEKLYDSSESDFSDTEEMSYSDCYNPEVDSECYSSDNETENGSPTMNKYENEKAHSEPKYIVFHNQLLLLLSVCVTCYSKNVTINYTLCGTLLTTFTTCLCCKTVREWRRQTNVKGIH